MKSYDLLELATRNLRQSILRNSLTTIGISVGVASLVSMLSLGIGLQRLASQRLGKLGLNAITVTSRRNGNFVGPGGAQRDPAADTARELNAAALREIAAIPNVTEAYPDIRFSAEVQYGDKTQRGQIVALTESAKTNGMFENIRGSFFSSDHAPEAMVERAFAAEILGRAPAPAINGATPAKGPDSVELAKLLVGKEVRLKYTTRLPGNAADGIAYSVASHEQPMKIVGVVDLDPEGGNGFGRGSLFVAQRFGEDLHVIQGADLRATTDPTFFIVRVVTKDPNRTLDVEAAIKKLGFNAFSALDAQRSAQLAFAIIDIFLGVFGSLALAVASIGIVNTLVMAILERQREIGIMKAIGASDSDVKRIFFAEAGAMGVLGGFVGVTLGWAIGRVINFGSNIYLARQNLPAQQIWFVPWWLVGGAIAFAVVVSLAAGWYPAARASRLDPVEALCYQ